MRALTWIAALIVTMTAALGCAAERPYVWVSDLPQETAPTTIRSQDKIFLLVAGQPTLSGEYVVGADGTIVQPVFGRVAVAGLTVEEASRQITSRLNGLVVDPKVTVSVPAPRHPEVNVVGEVAKPGHFNVQPGAGVLEAIARAGGLTEFADRDGIFVVREKPTRMRIRFRYEDLTGGDATSVAFELHDGDVVVVE